MPPENTRSGNVFDIALALTQTLQRSEWHLATTLLIHDLCERHAPFAEDHVSILPQTAIGKSQKRFFMENETSVCASVCRDNILIVDPVQQRALELAYNFGSDDRPDPVMIKTVCQFTQPYENDFADITSYHRKTSIALLEKMNVADDLVDPIRPMPPAP